MSSACFYSDKWLLRLRPAPTIVHVFEPMQTFLCVVLRPCPCYQMYYEPQHHIEKPSSNDNTISG